MRKAQKVQLLEILQTLQEAHEVIKKYIKENEPESARFLLGNCQQSAVQMGEVIEESEGADCAAVYALEDYCETLYQVGKGIPEAITVQKALKRLNRSLNRVESSVKADVPVRLEVVFLPYKRSMWDSLESVWRAADQDPSCDAYVIPIPYYDRNPDGSLGRLHYEGEMYPHDVPVVRYDGYDFEKRRPDAIFIHNGYDGYNYVTSVHPDFYSPQLKKYTELLLYIPYFISVNSISEGMCAVPGCWNADRAFVQSEKIRQEYIRIFEKMALEANSHCERGVLEQKIVALGSPKFDQVISSQAEEFDLPSQWRRLIYRDGGTRKKVVLYNTSIAAMLENNAQYLAKLRSVLEAFRERQDAVLWWRPHPLVESTLRSMRPHLLPEYLQIVRAYRQDGWGILDETADVNRAVVCADYYYGDGGSALQASFQVSGKPVMLQRVEPFDGSIAIPLILGSDDKRLLFAPLRSTSIFSLDLATHKISAVKPGHSTAGWPYMQGVRLDHVTYFTPAGAQAILSLNAKDGQFATIPYKIETEQLLNLNPRYLSGSNFSTAYTYNGSVFFVGDTYPAIMRLEPESGSLAYYMGWPSAFHNGSSYAIANCSCQMGSYIVLVGAASTILYFNMETGSFSSEQIPHRSAADGFSTVAYGDGCLWTAAKATGSILKFNPRTKEIVEYDQFPAGVAPFDDLRLLSVYTKGCFWLFPNSSNAIVRLCAESGEISIVRKFSSKGGNAAHLSVRLAGDNCICATRFFSPEITFYNAETGDYNEFIPPIEILRAVETRACEPKDIHETVLIENGIDTIETLLHASVRDCERLIADWISSPDGRAGERIYRYTKETILFDRTRDRM